MDPPGHAIRLRGGWEWHDPATPGEPPRRLALPTTWPADATTAARLVRRFNRPPIEAAERILLSMEQVDGLVSARLNGTDVVAGGEIGGLLGPTNRLILDVDLSSRTAETPWGEVALVIVPAKRIGEDRSAPLS
jgi:hypothetical protein